MRPIFLFLLVVLSVGILPVTAGDGKQKHAFAFHSEAKIQDGERRAFPFTINGVDKYFQMTPEITHVDFTAFVPFRAEDGSYGAVFTLNRRGTMKLEQWTIARQGSYMVASVDMKVVDFTQIDRPVKDGVIVLWRGLTAEHIEYLQRKLKLKVLGNDAAAAKKP